MYSMPSVEANWVNGNSFCPVVALNIVLKRGDVVGDTADK